MQLSDRMQACFLLQTCGLHSIWSLVHEAGKIRRHTFWTGTARPVLAWHVLRWHGPARFGLLHVLVWHGMARFSLARFVLARHGAFWHGVACIRVAWHILEVHGTNWIGTARHGSTSETKVSYIIVENRKADPNRPKIRMFPDSLLLSVLTNNLTFHPVQN